MLAQALMKSAQYTVQGTADASYIGGASNTSNTSTYTFTSQGIGTATSDRIVAVVASINGVGTYYISSITIGGVAATVYATGTRGGVATVMIAGRKISSGTTATIVVTLAGSGTPGRCRIDVFNIKNQTSDTPHRSYEDTATAPAAWSKVAYVPSGGAVVGGFYSPSTNANQVVSGWTEASDVSVEDSRHGSVYTNPAGCRNTFTITGDGGSNIYACFASWR